MIKSGCSAWASARAASPFFRPLCLLLDRPSRLLQGNVLARRILVSVLDQEPGSFSTSAESSSPHQHPRTVKLLAMKRKLKIALFKRRTYIALRRSPRSDVPDHYRSAAVLPFG